MSTFGGRQKVDVKSYGLGFLHIVAGKVPFPSSAHWAMFLSLKALCITQTVLHNKTAICHCYQDALKRSTRLPLSNKIQSAHVRGQESQSKRKYLQCIYKRVASSLASFLQMALKKAQRKAMIYSKGPGVFCPVA